MWRLGLVFVDIALHRCGPDVLPASRFLLGLVLAAFFFIGLATLQVDSTPQVALALLLADRVLYLGAAWLVLSAFDKSRRFVQTATALTGVDVFMNLVALPLWFWDDALNAPAGRTTLPQILLIVVFLWSLDVGGFILSKALAKPYIVGVSIVVVYFLLSMAVRDAFFPMVN